MTLKLTTYFFLIILFTTTRSTAETGCSTYQGLYPNSMNTTHSTTGNVYYHNTNYIPYRTWDEDPRCGIRDNKVVSQDTPCDVIGVRDYGVLVSYNPNDNTCIVNTPIDTHVLVLFVLVGVITVSKIYRSNSISEVNIL